MQEDSSPLHRLLYKPVEPDNGSPTSKQSQHSVPLSTGLSNGSNGRRKGFFQAGRRMVLMKKGCCRGGRCCTCVRSNLLTILTFGSVLGGIALGLILRTREAPWTEREIMYVTFPGDLFLRMLKCLILPLIVSSMVAALGGLDLQLSGRIGVRAMAYYMGTTFCAVVLGIILVSVIHPGAGNPDEIARAGGVRKVTTVDTLLDLVRNLFPPNIVEACISQYRTLLVEPALNPKPPDNSSANDTELFEVTTEWSMDVNFTEENATATDPGAELYKWKIVGESVEGMNILGLVVFAIVLGITIGYMREKGKPLLDFFHALEEAMMIITGCIIWLSPLGILFLVGGKILEMDTFSVIIGQLGMYFLTVMVGLFIHGFIVIPLIFAVITWTLPFRFIINLFEALFTAFGTSSSSATLPVTIRCLEEKNGVDRRVARFVLPIGATINMDGTALYEAVAALFIAQVRQVPMDVGKVIAVSITATAASIGAAGIPQAGLITMVMVLNAVGLPAEDVTLIIVVDWILDRFRTLINVLGDSVGAGIVNHMSRDELMHCPDPEAELQMDEVTLKHRNGEANEINKRSSTTAM